MSRGVLWITGAVVVALLAGGCAASGGGSDEDDELLALVEQLATLDVRFTADGADVPLSLRTSDLETEAPTFLVSDLPDLVDVYGYELFTNFLVRFAKSYVRNNRGSVIEDAAITLPTAPVTTEWGQDIYFYKMKVHREGTSRLDVYLTTEGVTVGGLYVTQHVRVKASVSEDPSHPGSVITTIAM